MDKKITLIITGQLRIIENQNPIDKIQYHIDKLKPHNTILFLWDNEYQQYKKEIDLLNLQTIIADSNMPQISESIIQNMLNALNRQHDAKSNYTLESCDKNFLINVLKQIYSLQYTFQNINDNSTAYIKTRYDNIYLNDFEIDILLNNFFHENNPIIATPFGGDYDKIGLGDLLTITNNKANNIFKNYYNTYIEEINQQTGPMNSELALRYIFKNLNQADIYRFHFILTNEKHLKNQKIIHANKNLFQQYGFDYKGEYIGQDNLFLPDYKII
jgi:hypothetical protein